MEKKGPSLFDAYFNIVEVTVYGQARFFNCRRRRRPRAEPSLGDGPPARPLPAAAAGATTSGGRGTGQRAGHGTGRRREARAPRLPGTAPTEPEKAERQARGRSRWKSALPRPMPPSRDQAGAGQARPMPPRRPPAEPKPPRPIAKAAAVKK